MTALGAWWARARAWVIGSLMGVVGLVTLALGVRRWGARERAAGAQAGAAAAREVGLERAREDDSARAAAELEVAAQAAAAEVQAIREADRRAEGPLTVEDAERLHARVTARRARRERPTR